MKSFLTKILLLTIFCGFTANASASPQMPDYLIFKGDTIVTYNLILEQYLQKNEKSNEGELFGLTFRDGASFNCWRGYQAIYEIKNDSLYLSGITSCGELYHKKTFDKVTSEERMREIFGDKVNKGKVFIDWYTGMFSFPKGNQLRWDGVFYRIFEEETLIETKAGKVKKVSEIKNYKDFPNRIDRRYEDTLSTIIFEELKKIEWYEEFDCSERYIVTINKKGKIKSVRMYLKEEEILDFYSKEEYEYCISTLEKALKHLRFDILKDKGMPIEEEVFIEIWIDSDGNLENWTSITGLGDLVGSATNHQ